MGSYPAGTVTVPEIEPVPDAWGEPAWIGLGFGPGAGELEGLAAPDGTAAGPGTVVEGDATSAGTVGCGDAVAGVLGAGVALELSVAVGLGDAVAVGSAAAELVTSGPGPAAIAGPAVRMSATAADAATPAAMRLSPRRNLDLTMLIAPSSARRRAMAAAASLG
ncbi:MAG: hypothetical protein KJ792_06260 [Actinobacteria bacterium]|nr:hypothetical protein [Actinomycetota bacterium]MCG2801781.1 hypothetical protein [Cellulomonas sp.]